MRRLLILSFIVANPMALSFSSDNILPTFNTSGIFNSVFSICQSDNNTTEWMSRVSIDGKPHTREAETRIDNPSDEDSEEKPSSGILEWMRSFSPRSIRGRIKILMKRICSAIPDPIKIPDINLSSVLKFHATKGRISGLRHMCEKRSYIPSITWKGFSVGLRIELKLAKLHFPIPRGAPVARTFLQLDSGTRQPSRNEPDDGNVVSLRC